MSFVKRDVNGVQIRNRVVLDCQQAVKDGEPVRVEQSHKEEVDINNIVKRHAGQMELIAGVAALQQFTFDDVTSNDFQENMNAILQAKETFEKVPSEIRKRFGNDPAAFMDFVHDPNNNDALIQMGLKEPPEPAPAPVQVQVVNPESPPPE